MNPENVLSPLASPRPTHAELVSLVAELTASFDRAEAILGPAAPALTSLEKRRTVKPRKGAEKILSLLAPIVDQHGLQCGVLTTDAMMGLLAEAETLKPLEMRVAKFAKRVSDERFVRCVDAWRMGLQFYALLRNRALADGRLKACLAPLTAIFAHRHPRVKEAGMTRVQARVKRRLEEAIALARRNGVEVGGGESGESAGGE